MPLQPSSTATYFVTSVAYERRHLFQVEANARLFIEVVQHYRVLEKYKLHAFVVMPDHVHLLITPQGITIERAMQLIKGGFSHRIESKFPVWQKGFVERRMRDVEEFITRKEYIHQNPVRAHLWRKLRKSMNFHLPIEPVPQRLKPPKRWGCDWRG